MNNFEFGSIQQLGWKYFLASKKIHYGVSLCLSLLLGLGLWLNTIVPKLVAIEGLQREFTSLRQQQFKVEPKPVTENLQMLTLTELLLQLNQAPYKNIKIMRAYEHQKGVSLIFLAPYS